MSCLKKRHGHREFHNRHGAKLTTCQCILREGLKKGIKEKVAHDNVNFYLSSAFTFRITCDEKVQRNTWTSILKASLPLNC